LFFQVLELAGNAARDNKKTRILPRCVGERAGSSVMKFCLV
jgi:hypothetical protein